ncbi:hypothetical protein LCGC14_1839220 [marine sediment metagenome]|uniref:Uncharacterized protein n=1 Tax=marine sediment metagenome TaxID=412755 RepID=A0A0F9IT52_9ZZZZ
MTKGDALRRPRRDVGGISPPENRLRGLDLALRAPVLGNSGD